MTPRLLYLPAGVALALLVLPLLGLAFRANWSTLLSVLTTPEALSALVLSFTTATIATVFCLIIGVPLALVMARARPRLAALMRAFVTVPLVLPPLVGGMALLYLLGRGGLIGQYLDLAFGLRLPFSTAAVVIAQTFVALPFLVISVEGVLRTSGIRYERVASTLGAGRQRVFWRVTLPLALPGLISGTVLCFARALGEFGATALFAGNQGGTTRTMPLAIYTAFNGSGVNPDQAVALALLLIAVAIIILVLVRGRRFGVTA